MTNDKIITSFGEFQSILENSGKSTDGQVLRSLLQQKFPETDIDRPSGPLGEQIDISGVYIFDMESKDELVPLIKRFISRHNWYVQNSDMNIYHTHRMTIRSKHSKGKIDTPIVVYHATPMENMNRILKQGLKPKSADIRHKYPPRIYLSTNVNSLYPLIKELKSWKYKGKDNPYCILAVDTTGLDLELYKDQDSLYSGNCYIQGKSIPKEKIWVYDENL